MLSVNQQLCSRLLWPNSFASEDCSELDCSLVEGISKGPSFHEAASHQIDSEEG